MSLDIHIAKSRDEAMRDVPKLSIDESLHDRIFFSKSEIFQGLANIKRMEDFYKDFTYPVEEIDTVRKELSILRKEFQDDTSIQTILERLDQTLAEAKSAGLNVYGFAD